MKLRLALMTLVALVVLPARAADEMRKLDFLVGDWNGEAVVHAGPGKGSAIQSEIVRSKLGGKVLLIQGTGRQKLENGSAGEVVHDAVGIVSFDEKTNKYRFDAWTERGGYVQAWFEANDNKSARWGFETPDGGKIRYSISLNDKGQWYEVGEFSRDGNQWMKFMDMTLTKAK